MRNGDGSGYNEEVLGWMDLVDTKVRGKIERRRCQIERCPAGDNCRRNDDCLGMLLDEPLDVTPAPMPRRIHIPQRVVEAVAVAVKRLGFFDIGDYGVCTDESANGRVVVAGIRTSPIGGRSLPYFVRTG